MEPEERCECGHSAHRHVKQTSDKRYCIEQGCTCGDYKPVSTKEPA